MAFLLAALWLSSYILAQSPVYGACNATFPYASIIKSRNFTMPIKLVVAIPGLNLTGSVQILNECSFGLVDFLYLGGPEATGMAALWGLTMAT